MSAPKVTVRVQVGRASEFEPCPTLHVVETVPDTRPGAKPNATRSQSVVCPTCGQ